MHPAVRGLTFLGLAILLASGCRYDAAGHGADGDGSDGNDGSDGAGADADVGDLVDASQPVDVDASPSPDGALPGPADAAPAPDAAPTRVAGTPCPAGTECPAGWICLDEDDGWPAEGACTAACTSDAECGVGAFCSLPLGDAATRLCFPDCVDCPTTDHVCSSVLAAADLGEPACLPGNPMAGNGSGCAAFFDCRGGQICVDNAFDAPGGYCTTVGCTVGNNATCDPGDGICIADGGLTFCVDTCASDPDCRAGDGYTCESVGGGTKLCLAAHRDPGAACNNDAECGPPPWDCLTGADFPGGYCSGACTPGDGAVCPDGAVCHDPTPAAAGSGDEFCADTCAGMGPGGGCRMGYMCQVSSVPMTLVCQ